MKPDPAALASLNAIIGHDIAAIERLDLELQRIAASLNSPAPDFRDLAAAAYTFHNLYNALENSFEQISRTFENHVVDQAQWHKELLEKMFLSIPKIRPAVLPPNLRKILHDLRGFRHIFRHSYDFELDAERLRYLLQHWNSEKTALIKAMRDFGASLLSA